MLSLYITECRIYYKLRVVETVGVMATRLTAFWVRTRLIVGGAAKVRLGLVCVRVREVVFGILAVIVTAGAVSVRLTGAGATNVRLLVLYILTDW